LVLGLGFAVYFVVLRGSLARKARSGLRMVLKPVILQSCTEFCGAAMWVMKSTS